MFIKIPHANAWGIFLPNKTSGLVRAIRILNSIKGISIVEFKSIDVIRHPLVQKIINRYDNVYE